MLDASRGFLGDLARRTIRLHARFAQIVGHRAEALADMPEHGLHRLRPGVQGVGRQVCERILVTLHAHHPLDDRVDVLGGERVVRHDQIVGHLERGQQHRRDHARPILACSAVIDGGAAGPGEDLDDPGDRLASEVEHADITICKGDELLRGRLLRGPRVAVEERPVVERDGLALQQPATVGLELVGRPQIHDVAHPELLAQQGHVGRGQGMECIAAKERAPTQRASGSGRIAAEITEVDAAFESDSSFHGGGV